MGGGLFSLLKHLPCDACIHNNKDVSSNKNNKGEIFHLLIP